MGGQDILQESDNRDVLLAVVQPAGGAVHVANTGPETLCGRDAAHWDRIGFLDLPWKVSRSERAIRIAAAHSLARAVGVPCSRCLKGLEP